MGNRYDQVENYVPAVARATRQPIVRIEGAHVQRIAESALQQHTNSEIDAAALRSLETVSEKSTPVQRAFGVVIKGALVGFVAALATLGLGKAGASGAQAWSFFVIVLVVGVAMLYWLDYTHSPIGGERHKAKLFAGIRHHEIEANERVSLAKLEAYQRTLEKVYGGQNDDD